MMAGCFASQITFHWFIAYFITTTALQYDGWIEASSPLLPRGAAGCAIGYNPSNNTIWILGGNMDSLDYQKQLISFNYINTVFTDHGTGIPRPIWGFSQNYVQIGTTLFMADSSGSSINTFNMETIVFQPYNISTDLSFDWDESCITNIRTEYIAVLGKDGNVQILNMDSDVWLDSVPSLNVARSGTSCIYINDKMFIIGGYDDEFVDQSSIEYLSVSTASMNNIASMLWTYTVDSLPFALSESRCVKVNDDILVIGGISWDMNVDTKLNTVYVIDSISGSVSLGGYLSKAVSTPAVVFINNMLYCFGGYTDNVWWDGWQTKAVTSTVSTTSEPTNNVISTSFSRASTTFDTHTTTVPMFGSSRQTNIGSTNVTDSAGHTTTVPIFRTKTQTSIGPTVNSNITFYPSVFTSEGDTQVNQDITDNNGEQTAVIIIILIIISVLALGFLYWCWNNRLEEHEKTEENMAESVSDDDANNNIKPVMVKQLSREEGANIDVTPGFGVTMDSEPFVEDLNMERNQENKAMIKSWLMTVVKLPIYYDILISNGYESMDFIKEIENVSELNDIGIGHKPHQKQLMDAINILKFKNIEGQQERLRKCQLGKTLR